MRHATAIANLSVATRPHPSSRMSAVMSSSRALVDAILQRLRTHEDWWRRFDIESSLRACGWNGWDRNLEVGVRAHVNEARSSACQYVQKLDCVTTPVLGELFSPVAAMALRVAMVRRQGVELEDVSSAAGVAAALAHIVCAYGRELRRCGDVQPATRCDPDAAAKLLILLFHARQLRREDVGSNRLHEFHIAEESDALQSALYVVSRCNDPRRSSSFSAVHLPAFLRETWSTVLTTRIGSTLRDEGTISGQPLLSPDTKQSWVMATGALGQQAGRAGRFFWIPRSSDPLADASAEEVQRINSALSRIGMGG